MTDGKKKICCIENRMHLCYSVMEYIRWEMCIRDRFKDELRKEEIKLEEQIEMLKNKEYDKMLAKFERELKRVRESLQD